MVGMEKFVEAVVGLAWEGVICLEFLLLYFICFSFVFLDMFFLFLFFSLFFVILYVEPSIVLVLIPLFTLGRKRTQLACFGVLFLFFLSLLSYSLA